MEKDKSKYLIKKKCIFLFVILSTFIFFSSCIIRIVKYNSLHFNCIQHLNKAYRANTIDSAKEELALGISYLETNNKVDGNTSIFVKQPRNDIEFFYNNLKSSYEDLSNLPENLSIIEKTQVLLQLKSILAYSNAYTTQVVVPSGIHLYPYNTLYFWISFTSFILMFIFWIWYLILSFN